MDKYDAMLKISDDLLKGGEGSGGAREGAGRPEGSGKESIDAASAKLEERGMKLGPAQPWKPGATETRYTVTDRAGNTSTMSAREIDRLTGGRK